MLLANVLYGVSSSANPNFTVDAPLSTIRVLAAMGLWSLIELVKNASVSVLLLK